MMTPLENEVKHSFPPVVDGRTRLLVLGSLPGEASLAAGRYYAHPRNQFWRLIGAVMGKPIDTMDYPERLATLLEGRIGLWDVVGSATRKGSLDSNIRDQRPNGLTDLIATLPDLVAIGFNGGTSASIGMKLLADVPLALVPLPSSSPAFTLSFEAKKAVWMTLRRFV